MMWSLQRGQSISREVTSRFSETTTLANFPAKNILLHDIQNKQGVYRNPEPWIGHWTLFKQVLMQWHDVDRSTSQLELWRHSHTSCQPCIELPWYTKPLCTPTNCAKLLQSYFEEFCRTLHDFAALRTPLATVYLSYWPSDTCSTPHMHLLSHIEHTRYAKTRQQAF
jgi:hypothetical protein